MKFPTFTVVKYVDTDGEQDGFLTPQMQYYEDQMNQVLRNGLSDNGWTVPAITAANLTAIEPDMPAGTIWYESDARVWVGKKDDGTGGFELVKFTTTPYP